MAVKPKKSDKVDQLSLYYLSEPEDSTNKNPSFKFDELNLRSLSLAIAAPLVKIIAQNETPPASLLDPYTLAMSAVSHVIDGLQLMNLEESSLTVKAFEDKVAADITKQYEALRADGRLERMPSSDETRKTATGILDKLLARKEGGVFVELMYRPLSQDFGTYEFRIFDQYYDSVEGDLHIRPTPEAANLYLNSMGQPLGDMQAALTALIERQLAKGDIASAIKSATQHLNFTRQHKSEILALKRQIERNASGVRWLDKIKPELDKIYDDVPYLLSQDEKIYNSLASNTQIMLSDKGYLARKVQGIIKDCFNIYRGLKTVVVTMPEEYRRARMQEGYFTSAATLPNIEKSILRPIMQSFTREMMLEIESTILAGCAGVVVPKCMDIKILTEKLTAPRRETREVFDPNGIPNTEEITTESIRNISEQGKKVALSALRSTMGKQVRVSDLIRRIEEDADAEDASEALLLHAIYAWRDNGYAGLVAEKTSTTFDSRFTGGDDYIVTYMADVFADEEGEEY